MNEGVDPSVGRWARETARRITRLEPVFVILAAPLLLFPGFQPTATAVVLGALLIVWLVGWFGTGRPGARTLLDGSLLMLALMVPIAVWASALPELTLPKLTGIILGLATFRATVKAVRTRRNLEQATAVFMLLGLVIATVGLLGAAWAARWPVLRPILTLIPRAIEGLPGAEMGINTNELGGALILFLPVSLAALDAQSGGRRWAGWAVRSAALVVALYFGALLVLTQSRSAWFGAVVGIGVMACLRWRAARWVLAVALLVAAVGLWYAGPQAAGQALFKSADQAAAGPMLSPVSLEGRLELWSRALYAIGDFALTGSGLGTFRQVVHTLYPLYFSGPDVDLAHAHNVFLQVALDLGLLGLIAYLALVGAALWVGWRVSRWASSRYRWLGLGIVGSLVAFHVYGLTDAIALGAKPGVAFWMLLALAAALWRVESAGEGRGVEDWPEGVRGEGQLGPRPQDRTEPTGGDRRKPSLLEWTVNASQPKSGLQEGLELAAGDRLKPPLQDPWREQRNR